VNAVKIPVQAVGGLILGNLEASLRFEFSLLIMGQ
jgi:hypothetical protein